MNNNEEKRQVPFIILEGKKYIYKEKYLVWANYVKEAIASGRNNINELQETISIMKLLDEGMYTPNEIVNILNESDFSAEKIYHIIKNLLLFYKEGTVIFREFFGKYMNPQLEEIIEKVEKENEEYRHNNIVR